MSNKHQAVIKIIKKLDTDLMVRELPTKFSCNT